MLSHTFDITTNIIGLIFCPGSWTVSWTVSCFISRFFFGFILFLLSFFLSLLSLFLFLLLLAHTNMIKRHTTSFKIIFIFNCFISTSTSTSVSIILANTLMNVSNTNLPPYVTTTNMSSWCFASKIISLFTFTIILFYPTAVAMCVVTDAIVKFHFAFLFPSTNTIMVQTNLSFIADTLVIKISANIKHSLSTNTLVKFTFTSYFIRYSTNTIMY